MSATTVDGEGTGIREVTEELGRVPLPPRTPGASHQVGSAQSCFAAASVPRSKPEAAGPAPPAFRGRVEAGGGDRSPSWHPEKGREHGLRGPGAGLTSGFLPPPPPPPGVGRGSGGRTDRSRCQERGSG